MIRIGYDINDTNCELFLIGHANYDNHGKDIVCAGVSAIVYSLIGMLQNNCGDDLKVKEDAGDVEITCDSTEKVKAAFEMAVIGLAQIALTYPNNVNISLH